MLIGGFLTSLGPKRVGHPAAIETVLREHALHVLGAVLAEVH